MVPNFCQKQTNYRSRQTNNSKMSAIDKQIANIGSKATLKMSAIDKQIADIGSKATLKLSAINNQTTETGRTT
ncbi:MAG: hypothetical protein E7302_07965 [Butyrivibrio sp.]|nr:hypothetical protein [Butyrivibrio sp.]